MIYEEFIEALKLSAHKELGYEYKDMEFLQEGYTSNDPKTINFIRDSNKRYANRESDILQMDFLVLKRRTSAGINMNRVATRRLYQDSEEKGFDAAFEMIRKSHRDIKNANVDDEKLKKRASTNYEDIRDQLIIRPLNYNLHKSELKDCIYRNVGDFVLVLYQLLGDANNSLVTSKINKQDLERWNMVGQEEALMQDALNNSMRLYPPSVYDQRTQRETDFFSKDFTMQDIMMMGHAIILSTIGTTNGAVALFYPGVVEKMMAIMGGSFLAVFMNINDVMIFKKGDPMAALYADSAKQSSKMGEMLSEKCYLCDENGINPIAYAVKQEVVE